VIVLTEKSAIPLFDRMQHHFSVLTKSLTAVARNGGPGRSRGRRNGALPWTAASTMAGFRLLRAATCISTLVTTVLPSDALADVKEPLSNVTFSH